MRRFAVVMLVTFGLALASGCTNRPTEPNQGKDVNYKKRMMGEEQVKEKGPKQKKGGGTPID